MINNAKPFGQPGGGKPAAPDVAAAGDRAARARRERQAIAYLDALDAQDFDAIGRLWEQAADDAELERVLIEVSEGVLEEAGHPAPADEAAASPGFAEDAAQVVRLLDKHLPSGTPAPILARPTVADVAAKIAADPDLGARLDAADRQANAKLLTVRMELPADMGMPQLTRWTAALPVTASAAYWRAFRQAAILAAMRHVHPSAGGNLAAARPAMRVRRPGKRQSETKSAGDDSGKGTRDPGKR
jgi:hypothetical protein